MGVPGEADDIHCTGEGAPPDSTHRWIYSWFCCCEEGLYRVTACGDTVMVWCHMSQIVDYGTTDGVVFYCPEWPEVSRAD